MLLLPITPVPCLEGSLNVTLITIHKVRPPTDRKPEWLGGLPDGLKDSLWILELHVGKSLELIGLIVMGQPHPPFYYLTPIPMDPPHVSESRHGLYWG